MLTRDEYEAAREQLDRLLRLVDAGTVDGGRYERAYLTGTRDALAAELRSRPCEDGS